MIPAVKLAASSVH